MKYVWRDCERCWSRNIVVIGWSDIGEKVDGGVIGGNKLNRWIKIGRVVIGEEGKEFLSV